MAVEVALKLGESSALVRQPVPSWEAGLKLAGALMRKYISAKEQAVDWVDEIIRTYENATIPEAKRYSIYADATLLVAVVNKGSSSGQASRL